MRIITRLAYDALGEAAALSRDAEAAGFDTLMSAENQHEPFFPLVVAARETSRIALWTGVAIAFPRSPMVVANAAFDLQELSRGRFVLGLGPQVKGHNERRFSVPWSSPAPRMREYVEALRAIWRSFEQGAALDYEGKHYRFSLMTPNFRPVPTGLPMVPVTLGAVGPGMLRVAAEVADGVQLHPFCTRAYLERTVTPILDVGLARAGLARQHFNVTGGGFIATGPDNETVARMWEFIRSRVAFYASTRTYWPVLAVHELEDLGAKLHTMSKRGQWDEMTASVPDEVVELFAVRGTHGEIVARIAERFADTVDQVMIQPAPDADPGLTPDLLQEIRALGTPFREFAPRW